MGEVFNPFIEVNASEDVAFVQYCRIYVKLFDRKTEDLQNYYILEIVSYHLEVHATRLFSLRPFDSFLNKLYISAKIRHSRLHKSHHLSLLFIVNITFGTLHTLFRRFALFAKLKHSPY